MYLAVVVVTMFVLPVGSVALALLGGAAFDGALVGRWFVVRAVGARLLLAGGRQLLQPRFTLDLLGGGDAAATLVRELGVHNLALAIAALLTVVRPAFTEPVAVVAAIFYGIAGVRHAAVGHRTTNETVAMVSDLAVAVVLAGSVAAIELA